MPMNRYEIRNEYSLADPELYKAADKDDPEALLEGVAMAGLVGVLRQLGDLAEFAAEIFRDLHEEVMMTASRGHGLMVRVQQLEADVPLIEKAFLSQTNHSSLFYNSGVDWHSNQKMDQNLITQGDLPRFIMDSYEECRGPPRLFLLDKFDIAGAGACLKRYSDPSSFKVEALPSGLTSTDVQREKKTRKAKKKVPRWRNGETPEAVLPTAHAKLHQLFLEEHVANGVSNPARRVKLKRKLNGFPFNLKTGPSYMEKLLNNSSPEHKVVHEVSVRSSPLKLLTNDPNETGPEVLEVRPVISDTESVRRGRSPPSSPDREGSMLQSSKYEPNEISTDDRFSEVLSIPNPSYEADDSSFALHRVTSENDISVDDESKTEGSLDGYHSDDIASERDSYVDAPSTMDSEMDTDSELKGKSDLVSLNIKRQLSISDANEQQLQAHSSDSQTVVTSTLSDDGNNSSKKEMPSFLLADIPSASAENSPSDRDASAEVLLSTTIPVTDIIDKSYLQETGQGDISESQDPNPVVTDDTCVGISEIPGVTNFGDLISSSCATDAIPTSVHFDSESFVGKGTSSQSDEMSSTCNEITAELINTEHNGKIMVMNLSCIPSIPSAVLQVGDDVLPRLSAENHLIDGSNGSVSENVPGISMDSHVHCHTRDNSLGKSGEYLNRNDSDKEDLNLHENMYGHLYMMSSKNTIPCIVDKDVSELHENRKSDHSDTISQHSDGCMPIVSEENRKSSHSDTVSQHSDGCIPIVSEEKQLVDELDDENPNVFSDASNDLSCLLEAAPEKANDENSLDNIAPTVGENDDYTCTLVYNQMGSPNSISPRTEEDSLYLPKEDFDPQEACDFVIFAEETTGNESLVVEDTKSCDSVRLQGIGISNDAHPLDLADVESSHCSEENLDKPLISDGLKVDGINPCTDLIENDATDITVFPDPTSLNDVHVQLDEMDSEAGQPGSAVMAATVADTDTDPNNNINEDGVEVVGINPCTDFIGKDATDITLSPDPTSLNEVHLQLDEIDSEAYQSGAVVIDATVADTDNNSNEDGIEMFGIKPCTDVIGKDATDISLSLDPTSLNEVHLQSDKIDSDAYQSSGVVMDTTVAATDIPLLPDSTSLSDVHVQLDEMDSGADQSGAVVLDDTVADTDNNSNVDGIEVGRINPCTDVIVKDATSITLSVDPTSLIEAHLQLDEMNSDAYQSGGVVMDTTVAATDNNSNNDDVSSSLDLNKLPEVSTCSSGDLDQNEFKTLKKCLPDSCKESGLAKEAGELEAAVSGSESALCSSPVDHVHPNSELSATVPHACLDLEVENSSDLINAVPTQALEQNGLAMEQESCQKGGLINHIEDSSTSHNHHNAEETILEKKIKLPPNQNYQEDFPDKGDENLEVPQLKHEQNLNRCNPEGSSNASSNCLLANIQNQPSVLEIPVPGSYDVNMSGYPNDPLISNLPSVNLSDANLINLEELPPLPPLPPVQWRMGKLQHASAPERVATQHNVGPFLSSLPVVADKNAQNQNLLVSAVIREDSPSFQEYSSGNIMHSGTISSQIPRVDHPNNTANNRFMFSGNQSMNSFSRLPEGYDEMPQDSSIMGKGSIIQSRLTPFSRETSVDIASTNNFNSSYEAIRPLHLVAAEIIPKEEVAPEIISKEEVATETCSKEKVAPEINSSEEVATEICSKEKVAPEIISKEEVATEISSKEKVAPEISSKEEKVVSSSSSVEPRPMRPEAVEFLPKTPVLVTPSSDSEHTSPPVEDGIANGSRTMKQPRPRNPLIDAVVARDKSKLRKVTERIRPEIQKIDERDSILEQIRSKSFNLKPALANRPSIQGPKTNLKVAAILEKANAIRQAFVGSDDDDEDSWSDP